MSLLAWINDIKKSHILGASAYLVKPQTLEGLERLIKVLLEFWMVCEVPEIDVTGKRR